MKDEDIIGKEFTCFEFPNDVRLHFDGGYKERIGLSAVAKQLHNSYPEYTNAEVTFENGRTEMWHYPTALIKQQIEQAIEDAKPVDLDAILLQIKNLIP